LVFGVRFFIEFLKEDQVAFEATMKLNMGQLLSIPFVLIGAWGLYKTFKVKKKAVIKR
jgi:prolipoprotein diacylglyceryltransferase